MINPSAEPRKKPSVPRLWTFYLAMAVDIVLIYVLNNLIYMNIAVLNSNRYISCLWAINLALGAGIIGNFVLLLYRPLWYYHFTQMVLNFVVVLPFFVIYRWFPFDIDSNSVQFAVKIVLFLAMAGPAVAGFVEMFKFLVAFFVREPLPAPAAGLSSVASEAVTPPEPSAQPEIPAIATPEGGSPPASPEAAPSSQLSAPAATPEAQTANPSEPPSPATGVPPEAPTSTPPEAPNANQ